MSLRQRLNDDLKQALRSGDDLRKSTLRLVLAAVKQAEIDKRAVAAKKAGQAPTDEQLAALEQIELTDDEVLDTLQKEAKARREAVADARQANRADLVAANEAELGVLESYLPQPLSREELVALARAAIAETGATDRKQMGMVMKLLAPRTKGRADGRQVSEVVQQLLSG